MVLHKRPRCINRKGCFSLAAEIWRRYGQTNKTTALLRFIHTADLHLDSPLTGLVRPSESAAPPQILGASRQVFNNLIQLAIAEQVDFMVIAGDVYDQDWKGYETGLFFRAGMVRLQQAGITVFLISGNHDAASVITRQLSLPGNVVTFSSHAPETHQPDRWPLAVHGMSFPNRAVPENLASRYPAPVPGKFNLGILHTSLNGVAGHDTYAPCSKGDLTARGYQYWALGHVHTPAVIQRDPWIVFPGNLQGRHVGECGERGCYIVTVNDDLEVSKHDWQPLDVVRWARLEVPLDGVDSFAGAMAVVGRFLAEAVQQSDDRKLAVRIVLRGCTPLHGSLHGDPGRLEAEIQAAAQDCGKEAVWIEQVLLETRPAVSLDDLAKRDSLTKVVIEVARQAEAGGSWPSEITDMLNVLPPSLRMALEREWSGPGRQALMQDACAIILDRLAAKGDAP